jgi:hypothetical protein
MAKITGNNDGPNGRNETYRVGNRFNVPRQQLTREIDRGLHDGYHNVNIGGQSYARDNPDRSTRDNVNKK